MTHHSRPILAVLALIGTCVSALPPAAHEGSHAPGVLARVEAATALGDRVPFAFVGGGDARVMGGVPVRTGRSVLGS